MIKNPFSVFDFFGYVFPGAFALMAVFYFVKMEPLNYTDPMSLGEVIATAKGGADGVGVVSIMFCVFDIVVHRGTPGRIF